MFPYKEQHKLYRKPYEVLSLADFSHYYEAEHPDYEKFPALKLAEGFDFILEPGDTLFMPAGYWHHMEYLDSGFAMSLRALQPSLGGKLKGAWNLIGMRSIDTMMKKTAPKWWYERKKKKVFAHAEKELAKL
jgi:ribosomal protein L16 Arg81 hydroxylase